MERIAKLWGGWALTLLALVWLGSIAVGAHTGVEVSETLSDPVITYTVDSTQLNHIGFGPAATLLMMAGCGLLADASRRKSVPPIVRKKAVRKARQRARSGRNARSRQC